MPLEDLIGPDKYLDALNKAWPENDDAKREGDDHFRGVKNVLQNTFPNLDGEVAFTASQMVLGIQNGIDHAIPIGMMLPYAGDPSGLGANYLPCDGAAVSRTTYSDLFALIGVTYGAGDGSTTFNVPNLDGLSVEGSGAQAVGATRGAADHELVEANIPEHSLNLFVNDVTTSRGTPAAGAVAAHHYNSNSEDEYHIATADNQQTEPNVFRTSKYGQETPDAVPTIGPRMAIGFAIRAL